MTCSKGNLQWMDALRLKINDYFFGVFIEWTIIINSRKLAVTVEPWTSYVR